LIWSNLKFVIFLNALVSSSTSSSSGEFKMRPSTFFEP
jgi:hypothetical protein